MTNSEIVHHQGGTTFAGPDAVNLVRAVHLKAALSLYAKTKMLMTRGSTPTVLLKIAAEYTGKKYKRGQHAQAADDLQVWIATMKAALPTTVEHADGTKEQL